MILRVYRYWKRLPPGVRLWLMRAGNALKDSISVGLTVYMAEGQWKTALYAGLAALIAGQTSLHQQLPRDPAGYRNCRADDPLLGREDMR